MSARSALIDGTELARTLARVAAERDLEFSTIDELCDIADEHDLWGEEIEARATRLYKKSLIRSIVRKPHEDEDGNVIEWVGIVKKDAATGREAPFYKQIEMFDEDDTEYVIRDRVRRAGKFIEEAIRFRDLGVSKFGKRFQKRFDFNLDDLKPPDA
jgi:hypothetical protein